MRGFVRKRGKTWTAYWETKDFETGRRRQKSKGGYRTQKDAPTAPCDLTNAEARELETAL